MGTDLLNCDLDLRTGIDAKAYDEMPAKLKESVIDLAFNKGVGAVLNNKALVDALNSRDYVTAIANLNQDYSVVKNKKGDIVHKPASGLSKRRLYEIANACEIFKNGYPSKILNSANNFGYTNCRTSQPYILKRKRIFFIYNEIHCQFVSFCHYRTVYSSS